MSSTQNRPSACHGNRDRAAGTLPILAGEITRGDRVWLFGAWQAVTTARPPPSAPDHVRVRLARLGVVELEATRIVACTTGGDSR